MFNVKAEDIVFDSFTKFSMLMYRTMLFTFVQLKGDESIARKVLHFARIAFYGFCLSTLFLVIAMMIAYGVVNSDDLIKTLRAVPDALTVTLVTIKGFVSFVQRKKIWKLIQELKTIFEARPHENVKLKVKKHLDNYHKKVVGFAATIFMMLVFIVLFPMFPFMLYGKMKLTVDYWFPFDAFVRENFAYALLWGDWAAWITLITQVGADSMCIALLALLIMEIDILKQDFKDAMSLPGTQRMERTIFLVDHHNKLLELCDDLSNIYAPNFLATFVITSFCLCLVAFQLSSGHPDFQEYSFDSAYLGMLAGQVYLICVFGHDLIDGTQEIADGVYESGWEDIDDEPFKRRLGLIIQRSRRPKKLTAMGFAEVSLLSFTTVNFKQNINSLTSKFLSDFHKRLFLLHAVEERLRR